MNEPVTVDYAIKRGKSILTYPGLLLMIVVMALMFAVGFQHVDQIWIWVAGTILFLISPWIWWSFMVPKWRIWAFSNVRNVHELKKRALQEQLIGKDNSFFTKTEIWTASDRDKWNAIQTRFLEADRFVIEEDLTVPFETIIYYSKAKSFFGMAFMLVIVAIGVYIIAAADRYVIGMMFVLAGGYLSYSKYKEATNKAPQIIIDENGLQTISTEFYEWKDIEQEEVEIDGSGKHRRHYLRYQHRNGTERLLIDDYNITPEELRRLLNIYRGRNMKKNGYR